MSNGLLNITKLLFQIFMFTLAILELRQTKKILTNQLCLPSACMLNKSVEA